MNDTSSTPSDTPPSEPASRPDGPPASAKKTETPPRRAQDKDPLRSSRASGVWGALVFLVVVLALLAIFVLQNTGAVPIKFLGWEGEAPLAAALLIATVSGLLIALTAGSIRLLQVRRRVRRERKSH